MPTSISPPSSQSPAGTVQKQYTSGPLSIAKWAEITNAHIFPGPAIVTSLKSAAKSAISDYNTLVHTEITAGPPFEDRGSDEDAAHASSSGLADISNGNDGSRLDVLGSGNGRDMRKQSVVSISKT